MVLHARSADRAASIGELAARADAIVVSDLRSTAEVRGIADQINAIGRMDAVIHNAGVYTERSRGATPDGHASTLSVNTLAPYLLTALIKRHKARSSLTSAAAPARSAAADDAARAKPNAPLRVSCIAHLPMPDREK